MSGTGLPEPRAYEDQLEVRKRLSHASANSHVVTAASGKLGHLSPGNLTRKRGVAKSKKQSFARSDGRNAPARPFEKTGGPRSINKIRINDLIAQSGGVKSTSPNRLNKVIAGPPKGRRNLFMADEVPQKTSVQRHTFSMKSASSIKARNLHRASA